MGTGHTGPVASRAGHVPVDGASPPGDGDLRWETGVAIAGRSPGQRHGEVDTAIDPGPW